MSQVQRRAQHPEQHGRAPMHVHIERLVLDGLAVGRADAMRLQASVERELGRLFNGAPPRDWTADAVNHLSAAPVHLAVGGSPAVWGRQIARSLFSTIAPPVAPVSTTIPTISSVNATKSHGDARAITT